MASAKAIEAELDKVRLDQGDEGNPEEEDAPPSYIPSNTQPDLSPWSLTPAINFQSYILPGSTLSDDDTTRTTTDHSLISNAEALYTLIKEQMTLPPKPIVRIKGTHTDMAYSWGTTRTDFNLTLDIMPMIMPTATTRLNTVDIKPIPDNKKSGDALKGWVELFCSDTAESKSFTLERTVTNWDTEYLKQHLTTIVASTRYKGNLEITFPITNSKVVINTSSLGTGLDAHKRKLLSGSKSSDRTPQHSLMPMHDPENHMYSPVQAIWPYADSSSSGSSSSSKEYASQSESTWLSIWHAAIRNGVLAQKIGWVTAEDWKDVVLGHVLYSQPSRSWGHLGDDTRTFFSGLTKAGSKHAAPRDKVNQRETTLKAKPV